MKKLFTLLTLLVALVTSAWATDHKVSATRTLSNEDKTCTWSEIVANGGSAISNGSNTATGDGLYFDCTGGKITLASGTGTKRNVKAGAIMYIQVVSASSAGTVTFTAGANDRYMQTESGGKVNMAGEDNGDLKGSLAFTSADIVDISGTPYLKLTSKSDCKFNTVAITLTSSEVFPAIVVETQEIESVSINGTALSASDLSTLKSSKAVTIDGTDLNGLGTLVVGLTAGSTTVSKEVDGTSMVFSFTINTDENYTVTVTNVVKTYTLEGTPVYYKKNEDLADGTNTNSLTANGINFAYTSKTFGFGNGSVTFGSDVYTPIKLSTGEGVTVTFPVGQVATKVKIYGWSESGNGKLNSIKETNSSSAKTVGDISSNIFYATNTAGDNYPSVYEYSLDNWTSMYFDAGGSASQPFVVMEFTLSTSATATIGSTGWATFVTPAALDFTGISDLKAYIVTGHTGTAIDVTQMTGTVPANTPLLLEGTTTAIPVAASSSTDVSANKLKAGTGAAVSAEGGKTKYVLSADGSTAVFKKINATAATVAAGKAYLEFTGDVSAPMLSMGGETTGINAIDNGQWTIDNYYNLAGQRVAQPTKGLYIVNGRKVVIK